MSLSREAEVLPGERESRLLTMRSSSPPTGQRDDVVSPEASTPH